MLKLIGATWRASHRYSRWAFGCVLGVLNGSCVDEGGCRPGEPPGPYIVNRRICSADRVMLEQQCFDDGDYVAGTYTTFEKDCAKEGARCFSGACVSHDEVCPAEHLSFCDATGVRTCVREAVAIRASPCTAEQHCIEVDDSGRTRAQCVVSDTPCSRMAGQCEDNVLVSCKQGFPVSRKECSGLASSCVEFIDSESAACRSPRCGADFFGTLCHEEQIIECSADESQVLAECGTKSQSCSPQANRAFCSTTGVLRPPTWQRIPAGTFTFVDLTAERPVALPSFEMLVTEVTVAQYQACIDDGVCERGGFTGPVSIEGNTPQTYLERDAPEQFCLWLGGRLPTESEWQYVATNLGTTRFPWGDAPPSCDLTVLGARGGDIETNCRNAVAEGCSLAGDQTTLGVCDLVGNVSELVSSPERPGATYPVGGNFESPPEVLPLVVPDVQRVGWENPEPTIGFRCVK